MDVCIRMAGCGLGIAGSVLVNKNDLIVLAITWTSVLTSCGIWWMILAEVL
jgi:hypothetical protein